MNNPQKKSSDKWTWVNCVKPHPMDNNNLCRVQNRRFGNTWIGSLP